MKLAIAILNWNGKGLLEEFLPSVVKYSSEASIYIIDNASTDDSYVFVKSNYPTIKWVQNKGNYGYAKGYNEGLKSINEEIVCLLNSDVEVTENWLNRISILFNQDENIAVIQPKLLDYKRKSHFEYAGAAGGFLDNLGYPYCRGRIFDTIEEDKGQYDDEREIFWASGAAFFIRKIEFDKIGGLDEDYFAHQEEIDLCWRLKNKGLKIYYTSQSTVYHLGGATLSELNPKKTFLNFRNSLLNLLKNLPLKESITKIFFRLCLDGIAGVRFLLKGDVRRFMAIIKAHFSFYNKLYKMYEKRKHSSEYSQSILGKKSILISYFLKNMKIYTDLKE